MAREEFLRNLRDGIREMGPTKIEYVPRGAGPDQMLQLDLWLTPHTVGGFVEQDFAEMSATDRAALVAAVTNFRQIAEQVDPHGPASLGAVQAGQQALSAILDILKKHGHVS